MNRRKNFLPRPVKVKDDLKVAQEFEHQKTHLKKLFVIELLNDILLHRENASLKLNIPVRKILYCKQMNM